MGILNLSTCATTARFAGITHSSQLRIVVYFARMWRSRPEFVSNLGGSGLLRGGANEAVCALFAPPTTEATAAAAHGSKSPPHRMKLWYCGVLWCGVERFLFDGFYLRGGLYWRNLCDVRPHHTTMGILNLNLHNCPVRRHRRL